MPWLSIIDVLMFNAPGRADFVTTGYDADLTAFTWKKSRPGLRPRATVTGRPWLQEFAQAPATLVFDDLVRVYFSCRPPPTRRPVRELLRLCRSRSRRSVQGRRRVAERPVLELGGLGDLRRVRHLSGLGHSRRRRVRAPTTPAGRDANRCRSTSPSACAVSRDGGVTFEKHGTGPVLPYSPDEPFVMSGPKIRRFDDRWYLWYIAGRKWKLVDGRPSPSTGFAWRHRPTASTGASADRDLIDAGSRTTKPRRAPTCSYANGRYHMFFCYRYSEDYRGKSEGYRIGYASSDLTNWMRDDAQGRHRRLGRGLGLGDDQLSACLRAGRQDLHGLSGQPGRPAWLRTGAARGRLTGDEVEQASARFSTRRNTRLPTAASEFAQSPQALVFDDFVRIYFSTRARRRQTAST